MKKRLLLFFLCGIVFIALGAGVLRTQYAVPILMYHSFDVNRLEEYSVVTPEVFSRQMEFIRRGGYRVISLPEYVRLRKEGRPFAHNLVVITIDDGHEDNTLAARILKEYGFPATIFLIADKIGSDGYLSREEVSWFLENTPGDIGSHTLTHAYLPDTCDTDLHEEIALSRKKLEEMFSRPVTTISYPVGGFDRRALEEAEQAGYICACATNRGFTRKEPFYALRRIKITQDDTGLRLWTKLSGYYNLLRKPKSPF